jgi:hypothetical protein
MLPNLGRVLTIKGAMSLPSLGALAWPPRGDGVRTGMVTDDEEDAPGVVPPAPAPAPAPGPPNLLTEQQEVAAYQYVRSAMYDQFELYLDEAYPDDEAEDDEFTVYRKEYERWEEADTRRSVDYDNSDGRTIAASTADERVIKAVRIIAHRARDAVIEWEADLYVQMETSDVAARLDGVAQAAVELVENYMRQDSDGFFDEAAEERAVEEMADILKGVLDPN